MDTAEVRRTEESARTWEGERTDAVDGSLCLSGADIFNYLEKVRWQAHHSMCDRPRALVRTPGRHPHETPDP
ncbi:hypothetical protein ACFYNW_37630 [Streptomyces virginiae]|uniref:hypothetical protein n=1 Tax=Streptomyces virginiae TaxID=1961 RepID=UPI0036E086E3